MWQDSARDGGVVSLVSENSRTGFCHLTVEDTTGETEKAAGVPGDSADAFDQERGFFISRNGNRILPAQRYVETAPGMVVYRLEPCFADGRTYVLQADITVHKPQSLDCYPILYVRGNPAKKIGLSSNGACTALVDQKGSIIADEDAESTGICLKHRRGEKYHVRLESGPKDLTVWINGSVVYRRQPLSHCLSGDFSDLPIAPEIVCVQGKGGDTRTEIENLVLCLLEEGQTKIL